MQETFIKISIFMAGAVIGLIVGQLSVWSYIKRKTKEHGAIIMVEGTTYRYVEKREMSPLELARFDK